MDKFKTKGYAEQSPRPKQTVREDDDDLPVLDGSDEVEDLTEEIAEHFKNEHNPLDPEDVKRDKENLKKLSDKTGAHSPASK